VKHQRTMAEKVLIGMSGGIDSSAAAGLLLEKGYNPVGITFVISPYSGKYLFNREAERAKKICDRLNIPHITLEIEDFEEEVVKPFVNSYLKGETPNPCIICNRWIKFKHLYQEAEKRDIQKIATGHYARLNYNQQTGRYELLKGIDKNKDQSYFLWQLPQKFLSRIVFPLDNIKKSQVNHYIEKNELIDRKTGESQDICFIPNNNYRKFLDEYKPDLAKTLQDGEIVNSEGDVLAKHNGFYNFTIGQRKGFHVNTPGKNYVKSIDPENNRIIISSNEELFSDSMVIKNCNWISMEPKEEIEGFVKPRYRSKGAKCKAFKIDVNKYRIDFKDKQRALTPGQSAVLYQDDKVIFGGIIK